MPLLNNKKEFAVGTRLGRAHFLIGSQVRASTYEFSDIYVKHVAFSSGKLAVYQLR